MNRSADWLHQAQLSADAGHHDWACFACHQAAEKALKALHLHHGQQSWGHGLGRSFRDLPPDVGVELADQIPSLDDRLFVLTPLELEQLLASSSRMAVERNADLRWLN
jgi:HEPN domain-containing protein